MAAARRFDVMVIEDSREEVRLQDATWDSALDCAREIAQNERKTVYVRSAGSRWPITAPTPSDASAPDSEPAR